MSPTAAAVTSITRAAMALGALTHSAAAIAVAAIAARNIRVPCSPCRCTPPSVQAKHGGAVPASFLFGDQHPRARRANLARQRVDVVGPVVAAAVDEKRGSPRDAAQVGAVDVLRDPVRG